MTAKETILTTLKASAATVLLPFSAVGFGAEASRAAAVAGKEGVLAAKAKASGVVGEAVAAVGYGAGKVLAFAALAGLAVLFAYKAVDRAAVRVVG